MEVAGKDGKEGENSGCDNVFDDTVDADAAPAGTETEEVDPDDREMDDEVDRVYSAGLKKSRGSYCLLGASPTPLLFSRAICRSGAVEETVEGATEGAAEGVVEGPRVGLKTSSKNMFRSVPDVSKKDD